MGAFQHDDAFPSFIMWHFGSYGCSPVMHRDNVFALTSAVSESVNSLVICLGFLDLMNRGWCFFDGQIESGMWVAVHWTNGQGERQDAIQTQI